MKNKKYHNKFKKKSKNKPCYTCGQIGHLSRNCPTNQNPNLSTTKYSTHNTKKNRNYQSPAKPKQIQSESSAEDVSRLQLLETNTLAIDARNELLIFGYIRRIKKDIPFDITKICIEYAKYASLTMDTAILSLEQETKFINLMKLTKLKNARNYKLIYRATRDGFDSSKFYHNCGEVSKTIVLILTTKNNIFGGYTENTWLCPVLWNNNVKYKSDKNAFLFLIENNKYKTAEIFKIRKVRQNMAVQDSWNEFLCFGIGDLNISLGCDKNNKSSSEHACYSLPSRWYLNGDEKYFQVKDIEVFGVD